MSTKIDSKKMFYIDSNSRLTGTTSDFTVTLNINQTDDFTHACIIQCLIPKSYYLVQSGSNTFQLKEGASTVTITIPAGNYSRRSFQSVLQGLLNAGSPNLWTYTISYPNSATSADTGKFTYSVSGNTSQPQFILGSDVIYEQLGFLPNTSPTFSGDSLTSVNVIKMQREDALYLHSDLVQNKEGDNVLQAMFASSDFPTFSNIVYKAIDVEANSKQIVTSKGNVYRFFLTNESGLPIDLNGLNITFSLMVYKQNDLSSLIKGAIKYFTLKL